MSRPEFLTDRDPADETAVPQADGDSRPLPRGPIPCVNCGAWTIALKDGRRSCYVCGGIS